MLALPERPRRAKRKIGADICSSTHAPHGSSGTEATRPTNPSDISTPVVWLNVQYYTALYRVRMQLRLRQRLGQTLCGSCIVNQTYSNPMLPFCQVIDHSIL